MRAKSALPTKTLAFLTAHSALLLLRKNKVELEWQTNKNINSISYLHDIEETLLTQSILLLEELVVGVGARDVTTYQLLHR